jgi:hypothetical protein
MSTATASSRPSASVDRLLPVGGSGRNQHLEPGRPGRPLVGRHQRHRPQAITGIAVQPGRMRATARRRRRHDRWQTNAGPVSGGTTRTTTTRGVRELRQHQVHRTPAAGLAVQAAAYGGSASITPAYQRSIRQLRDAHGVLGTVRGLERRQAPRFDQVAPSSSDAAPRRECASTADPMSNDTANGRRPSAPGRVPGVERGSRGRGATGCRWLRLR